MLKSYLKILTICAVTFVFCLKSPTQGRSQVKTKNPTVWLMTYKYLRQERGDHYEVDPKPTDIYDFHGKTGKTIHLNILVDGPFEVPTQEVVPEVFANEEEAIIRARELKRTLKKCRVWITPSYEVLN